MWQTDSNSGIYTGMTAALNADPTIDSFDLVGFQKQVHIRAIRRSVFIDATFNK